MSRALLDTSVLIAREQGRPLRRHLPEQVAVSVVSIAELEVGVLVARDSAVRGRRLRTLTEVRSLGSALPIDERIASAYAQLAADSIGRGTRRRIHDTWIAATALVNDVELWTQDGDFTDFSDSLTVVSV